MDCDPTNSETLSINLRTYISQLINKSDNCNSDNLQNLFNQLINLNSLYYADLIEDILDKIIWTPDTTNSTAIFILNSICIMILKIKKIILYKEHKYKNGSNLCKDINYLYLTVKYSYICNKSWANSHLLINMAKNEILQLDVNQILLKILNSNHSVADKIENANQLLKHYVQKKNLYTTLYKWMFFLSVNDDYYNVYKTLVNIIDSDSFVKFNKELSALYFPICIRQYLIDLCILDTTDSHSKTLVSSLTKFLDKYTMMAEYYKLFALKMFPTPLSLDPYSMLTYTESLIKRLDLTKYDIINNVTAFACHLIDEHGGMKNANHTTNINTNVSSLKHLKNLWLTTTFQAPKLVTIGYTILRNLTLRIFGPQNKIHYSIKIKFVQKILEVILQCSKLQNLSSLTVYMEVFQIICQHYERILRHIGDIPLHASVSQISQLKSLPLYDDATSTEGKAFEERREFSHFLCTLKSHLTILLDPFNHHEHKWKNMDMGNLYTNLHPSVKHNSPISPSATQHVNDINTSLAFLKHYVLSMIHCIDPFLHGTVCGIRESLLVHLRRCIFSRKVMVKMLGLFGFTELLKHLRIPIDNLSEQISQTTIKNPTNNNVDNNLPITSTSAASQIWSQSQQDSMDRPYCNANNVSIDYTDVCLEIMRVVKRTLLVSIGQEGAILKAIFYKQVYGIVKSNPILLRSALECLFDLWEKVSQSSLNAVFKWDLIIQTTTISIIVTDYPYLLMNSVISLLLYAQSIVSKLEKVPNVLTQSLLNLIDSLSQKCAMACNKLVECDLEDFSIIERNIDYFRGLDTTTPIPYNGPTNGKSPSQNNDHEELNKRENSHQQNVRANIVALTYIEAIRFSLHLARSEYTFMNSKSNPNTSFDKSHWCQILLKLCSKYQAICQNNTLTNNNQNNPLIILHYEHSFCINLLEDILELKPNKLSENETLVSDLNPLSTLVNSTELLTVILHQFTESLINVLNPSHIIDDKWMIALQDIFIACFKLCFQHSRHKDTKSVENNTDTTNIMSVILYENRENSSPSLYLSLLEIWVKLMEYYLIHAYPSLLKMVERSSHIKVSADYSEDKVVSKLVSIFERCLEVTTDIHKTQTAHPLITQLEESVRLSQPSNLNSKIHSLSKLMECIGNIYVTVLEGCLHHNLLTYVVNSGWNINGFCGKNSSLNATIKRSYTIILTHVIRVIEECPLLRYNVFDGIKANQSLPNIHLKVLDCITPLMGKSTLSGEPSQTNMKWNVNDAWFYMVKHTPNISRLLLTLYLACYKHTSNLFDTAKRVLKNIGTFIPRIKKPENASNGTMVSTILAKTPIGDYGNVIHDKTFLNSLNTLLQMCVINFQKNLEFLINSIRTEYMIVLETTFVTKTLSDNLPFPQRNILASSENDTQNNNNNFNFCNHQFSSNDNKNSTQLANNQCVFSVIKALSKREKLVSSLLGNVAVILCEFFTYDFENNNINNNEKSYYTDTNIALRVTMTINLLKECILFYKLLSHWIEHYTHTCVNILPYYLNFPYISLARFINSHKKLEDANDNSQMPEKSQIYTQEVIETDELEGFINEMQMARTDSMARFEKLMKLVNELLTHQIYEFLNHIHDITVKDNQNTQNNIPKTTSMDANQLKTKKVDNKVNKGKKRLKTILPNQIPNGTLATDIINEDTTDSNEQTSHIDNSSDMSSDKSSDDEIEEKTQGKRKKHKPTTKSFHTLLFARQMHKIIPELIFRVEESEKNIITFSQRTKNPGIIANLKLGLARDFSFNLNNPEPLIS